MSAPRFTRFTCYRHIEKTIEHLKETSPARAKIIVPVLAKLQREIERWNGSRPFRRKRIYGSMAVHDKPRLDNTLFNFGFRRLPVADPKTDTDQKEIMP